MLTDILKGVHGCPLAPNDAGSLSNSCQMFRKEMKEKKRQKSQSLREQALGDTLLQALKPS